MQSRSALCVSVLVLATVGYSQPLGRPSASRDQLGISGVIPKAPEGRADSPSRALVSLTDLRHRANGKAQREMREAQKAYYKKDLTTCVNHLKRAVELDPEFLEARQELGRAYAALDQPERVIEAFQAVLKLDPRSADAYSFIGAADASLDQYRDAEDAARQALRIVPSHRRARFVLGLSLAAQKKNDSEALQCLTESFDVYPVARMFAAHVLARRGQAAEARKHLETYLEIAPRSDRATVEDWLSRLEPAPASPSAVH